MNYKLVEVIENKEICSGIFSLKIKEEVKGKAGQFYMLKLQGGTLLPRPISLCEWEDGVATFLYAIVGNGTKEYKALKAGQTINVTGPLGNGFTTDRDLGRVALVAGGIGTAPFLQVSKELRNNFPRNIIDMYVGFREEVYLIEELKEYCNEVNIATNTGKFGVKGFVTDILDLDKYDTVLCCGPEIMMKKVVDMAKEKGKNIYVSLEKHMACGVGACLVCTCKTKEGNKRTCKDGPVFDGYFVEL